MLLRCRRPARGAIASPPFPPAVRGIANVVAGASGRRRLRGASLRLAVVGPDNGAESASSGDDSSKSSSVSFVLQHHVDFGEAVCLVGNDTALGAWSVEDCVSMKWSEGDVWTTQLSIPAGQTVEYKYIVTNEDGSLAEWLPGDNKVAVIPTDGDALELRDSWAEAAAEAEAAAAAEAEASSETNGRIGVGSETTAEAQAQAGGEAASELAAVEPPASTIAEGKPEEAAGDVETDKTIRLSDAKESISLPKDDKGKGKRSSSKSI